LDEDRGVDGDADRRKRIRWMQRYLLNPPVKVAVWAGLAPGYALVETTGRRTGKRRRNVVGMKLDGSTGWVVAEQGRHAGYVSNLAATWVAEQVSRAAIVSCDPVMCDVLRQHGFPVSDLMELRPGGTGVLHSVVVVATSAIRQEVGGILSSVYAPGVLARFGKGARQIDIRTVAQQGPATYQQQLSADQRARRESGAELLTSSRITATPSARRELTAGLVDSRLLVTIAALAGQRPVKILGFGHSGPGVTPATSPLRSVELTQMPGGRQLPRAEFLRSTLAFLRAQRSPFYASGVQEIRMTGGGTALRVIFSAPSPLGLLSGAVATPPGG